MCMPTYFKDDICTDYLPKVHANSPRIGKLYREFKQRVPDRTRGSLIDSDSWLVARSRSPCFQPCFPVMDKEPEHCMQLIPLFILFMSSIPNTIHIHPYLMDAVYVTNTKPPSVGCVPVALCTEILSLTARAVSTG